MKRRIKGIVFLLLGVALLLMAGGWYIHNLAEDNNAGKQAADILDKMEAIKKGNSPEEYIVINTITVENAVEDNNPQRDNSNNTESLPETIQNENAQNREPSVKEYTVPVIIIDGEAFCGRVEIEKLEIELPVYDEWNYKRLKKAPCRYMGNVATNDIIIAAHNYKSHFGNLKDLEIGDEIKFTDPLGNEYVYAVCEITTLDGTAVSDMNSGGWDFTLFTCTKGGKQRVTVRCERK